MILEYQEKVKDVEWLYQTAEKSPKMYTGEWTLMKDESIAR